MNAGQTLYVRSTSGRCRAATDSHVLWLQGRCALRRMLDYLIETIDKIERVPRLGTGCCSGGAHEWLRQISYVDLLV
jgi:hypothetical protein